MLDSPNIDAFFAEVQSLKDECQTLQRRYDEMVAFYEAIRPMWAKGYSSDSMAAQASTGALTQIWQLLGVKDQTAAIKRIRDLLETEMEFKYVRWRHC